MAVNHEMSPTLEREGSPVHPDLGRILIEQWELEERVQELGREISQRYGGREPLLLGVLKGSVFFLSDLVRAVSIPVTFDFISISRYQRSSSEQGEVQIIKDVETDIQGKDVILVEDIIDTGLTMNYLIGALKERHPASLEVCTLLNRPHLRLVPLSIRFVGFSIPNDFVVGYGLDFREHYRHLSHIRFLNRPAPAA